MSVNDEFYQIHSHDSDRSELDDVGEPLNATNASRIPARISLELRLIQ